MVKKMTSHTQKHSHMLVNDDSLLKQTIDDLRNANKSKEANEYEDDHDIDTKP